MLEVSSRGVSRPLTEPKHYRRNGGRLVALTLADAPAVTGRIPGRGRRRDRPRCDGATRRVGYAEIVRAVVQAELTKGGDEDDDPDIDDSDDPGE